MNLRTIPLLLCLTACDVVWGISGEPPPCDLGDGAFADNGGTVVEIPRVEHVSVAVDNGIAIGAVDGRTFEKDVSVAGVETFIDLVGDGFQLSSFGLSPEGALLFFSTETEPPRLQVATRDELAEWRVSSTLEPPAGFRAGSPSAEVFGPRRVMVKIGSEGVVDGDLVRDVQEYVQDGDGWRAVGERQAMPGLSAPNLTPNGMSVVFGDRDEEGNSIVVMATRDSIEDAFSGRTVVFRVAPLEVAEGVEIQPSLNSPQLRGGDILDQQCNALFVAVDTELRKYAR